MVFYSDDIVKVVGVLPLTYRKAKEKYNEDKMTLVSRALYRMEDEESSKLVAAWISGQIIETFSLKLGTWTTYLGNLSKFGYYRAAPAKPSVDWEHVSEDFNYLATDKNGESYLFDKKPTPNKLRGQWVGTNTIREAGVLSSLRKGTVDWEDSLVERK